MKRKIIGGALCLLLVVGFSMALFGQAPNYPSLIPASNALTNLMPAHVIQPPFPYTYYIIGQSWVDTGAVSTPWNWTYAGFPVWAMEADDTASSNAFRFPAGVDKAYLSGTIVRDTNTACSTYYGFGFETRNSKAGFGSDPDGVGHGTLQKGWYQVGTRVVNGEAAGCGRVDTLVRTLMSFPTKAIGDEWKISCTTNNADHKDLFDSLVVAACQVTFGFAGDKQYFVQYYPDPAQSNETGGKLFQSTGRTGADTTLTCRAPAFSTFTVWAKPTANGDSLKAYVAVDAKALRGLKDVASWYALDSVYLNGAADSLGEVVIIPSATKGFFSEYRIRTNPLKRASGNDSTTTLKLEIYGTFSP